MLIMPAGAAKAERTDPQAGRSTDRLFKALIGAAFHGDREGWFVGHHQSGHHGRADAPGSKQGVIAAGGRVRGQNTVAGPGITCIGHLFEEAAIIPRSRRDQHIGGGLKLHCGCDGIV